MAAEAVAVVAMAVEMAVANLMVAVVAIRRAPVVVAANISI